MRAPSCPFVNGFPCPGVPVEPCGSGLGQLWLRSWRLHPGGSALRPAVRPQQTPAVRQGSAGCRAPSLGSVPSTCGGPCDPPSAWGLWARGWAAGRTHRAEGRSQACQLGLPRGWQGLRCLRHIACFARSIRRELAGKWSSGNRGRLASRVVACYATVLASLRTEF